MGVQVSFNFQVWLARYPEFCSVSPAAAQEYFNEATIYLRNDGGGPVSSAAIQSTLLNMLTAHIAQIYAARNGVPASELVGRIDQATQGTVSVHAEMDLPAGSAQWFAQTKYGASYWQASAQYRTMRYIPPPPGSNPVPFRGPVWGR